MVLFKKVIFLMFCDKIWLVEMCVFFLLLGKIYGVVENGILCMILIIGKLLFMRLFCYCCCVFGVGYIINVVILYFFKVFIIWVCFFMYFVIFISIGNILSLKMCFLRLIVSWVE